MFFSPQGAVYPIQSQPEPRHHFHVHVVPTTVAFERKNQNFEFCRGWQAQKLKFRAQTPFPCPGCDHCCCYIIDCLSPQVSNLFPCDTCLTAVLWQWESGISWLHYSLKLQFSQWQCIVWVSSRPAQNLWVLKLLKKITVTGYLGNGHDGNQRLWRTVVFCDWLWTMWQWTGDQFVKWDVSLSGVKACRSISAIIATFSIITSISLQPYHHYHHKRKNEGRRLCIASLN